MNPRQLARLQLIEGANRLISNAFDVLLIGLCEPLPQDVWVTPTIRVMTQRGFAPSAPPIVTRLAASIVISSRHRYV